VSAIPDKLDIQQRQAGTVRWVKGTGTEAERVMRSLTGYGCLDLVPPVQLEAVVEEERKIRKAAVAVMQKLNAERRAGIEVGTAQQRVAQVKVQLLQRREQVKAAAAVRRRRKGQAHREILCRYNRASLEAYVASFGHLRIGGTRRTYTEEANALINASADDGGGRSRIVIKYTYPEMGLALMDAGYITACREYAMGPDPFKWPSQLRDAAFAGIGALVCDDSSAYPRARSAMVPDAGGVTSVLLQHKEEILAWKSYVWRYQN